MKTLLDQIAQIKGGYFVVLDMKGSRITSGRVPSSCNDVSFSVDLNESLSKVWAAAGYQLPLRAVRGRLMPNGNIAVGALSNGSK